MNGGKEEIKSEKEKGPEGQEADEHKEGRKKTEV